MKDERIIVIDINLTRGLVSLLALALLVAALLGYLAWGQREAAASGPQAPLDDAQAKPLAVSAGLRRYYLTTIIRNGANADTACAEGYHFASLWEIMDPSNLKYDTTLGSTCADCGQGPPTLGPDQAGGYGWVRTGYNNSTSGTPGVGNCNAWTSSSGYDFGTFAWLPTDWTAGQDMHIWEVWSDGCDWGNPVWCVED